MYLRIDERPADRIAVVEDTGRSYTFGDLRGFVEEFASWIPARSLIFILCQNTMGAFAAHVASIEKKIVPLMISSHMDAMLRNTLIETYKPEFLWMPEWLLPEFPDGEVLARKFDYALIRTGYAPAKLYEDLAMLLTTSGSTGSPKLVRHRYRNLYANAENVAAFFGFNENDRSLIDLQLHYTMGLNVACSSLYAGATLIMTTKNVMDKQYWEYFKAQRVTNITGVPYTYEMLKKLRFFRMDLPHLRIVAEGGGRLTDELFREVATYARDTGKQFFATFGTSETTARLAFLPPECALERIGSIGKAIPHGRLSLIDDDGSKIEQAEATGELVYSGENVTLGYALNAEDLLKGDERHGVYRTGDLAHRDADGFYYIIGRKSRFLKLFGFRVGLDESERLIRTQFGIECACTGNDERMLIFVTAPDMESRIRKFMAEKTGILVSAFAVRQVAQIPKNEVGKILYSKLMEEA